VPVFVVKYPLIDKLTVALLLIKRKKNRTQTKIAVDTRETCKNKIYERADFSTKCSGFSWWSRPKAFGIVRLL
jgi:hypothetical protein